MCEVSPIPIKRRVRFTRNGKPYTDKATQADLKRIAESYRGKFYETESLALVLEIFRVKPKASKEDAVPFTVLPDVDNVLKAVMDGLQGVAFANDKQITATLVIKHDRTASIEGEYIRYHIGTYQEMGRYFEQAGKISSSTSLI